MSSRASSSAKNVIHRPVHIVHSPYKTGTTSVGAALLDLGVGARDMQYNGEILRRYRKEFELVNRIANKEPDFRTFFNVNEGNILEILAEFVEEIRGFDIFSDAPFGHVAIHPYVKKVLAPKAKFIWIHRDFYKWLDSIERWEVSHPNTYRKFGRWKTDRKNKISELRRMRKMEYKKFFRLANNFPEDCLELNLEELDSVSPLCEFYGLRVRNTPFPKKNVGTIPADERSVEMTSGLSSEYGEREVSSPKSASAWRTPKTSVRVSAAAADTESPNVGEHIEESDAPTPPPARSAAAKQRSEKRKPPAKSAAPDKPDERGSTDEQ